MSNRKMYKEDLMRLISNKDTHLEAFDKFSNGIIENESVITEKDVSTILKWKIRVGLLEKVRALNKMRRAPLKKVLHDMYKDFNASKSTVSDADYLIKKYNNKHKILGDDKLVFSVRQKGRGKMCIFTDPHVIRVYKTNKKNHVKNFSAVRDVIIYSFESHRNNRPSIFLSGLIEAIKVFNGVG
ncbi:hypothetical protein E1N66_18805 [Pantoea allii]|nr:hypothetical protein E1N66_18805 [Pantoea allii]